MSERRCECWDNPCVCEPQEGASPVRHEQSKSAETGAPSCDSAELAEIRADDARQSESGGLTKLEKQRRALLRMVDELTKARARSADAIRNRERESLDAMAEADELRAKLAEAEKNGRIMVAADTRHLNEAREWMKRAEAAEKKLAESEKLRDHWLTSYNETYDLLRKTETYETYATKRAEAAEARVKELETELDATIAPPMGAGGE